MLIADFGPLRLSLWGFPKHGVHHGLDFVAVTFLCHSLVLFCWDLCMVLRVLVLGPWVSQVHICLPLLFLLVLFFPEVCRSLYQCLWILVYVTIHSLNT